jgi:hypothetical protein
MGTARRRSRFRTIRRLLGRTLYARWYVSDPALPMGVAASAVARFRIFGAHGAVRVVLASRTIPRCRACCDSIRARRTRSPPTPDPLRSVPGANVRLAVYDVSGREVRRLMDGAFQTPGSYSVRWDGLDNAGRWLPAGLYFYRVESDHAMESGRVVVSRADA